ncbi:MAG TPA: lactate utilization protein [Phycisphaerae bacterium]|nr:lactate utilization protein [Phycisphaerae bacterium]HRW53388.1 lactate utilization protein [Phycisphaerae bacterium]
MNGRAAILARIQSALARPTDVSIRGDSSTTADRAFSRFLPRVGPDADALARQFAENAASLHAEFHHVDSRDHLVERLRELATENDWRTIATHDGPLAKPASEALRVPLHCVGPDDDAATLAQCDAGISECDALIAQTGSVLVTAASAGGRALSVLTPHHVVLATRSQLTPDLPTAFELLARKYADACPSMISFITGPSRTGDIERTLVLGAHGPRRLTLFLLESEE